MIEIIYDQATEAYRAGHDGRWDWDISEIEKHISSNGHPRERASFVVPFTAWEGARDIANRVDRISDEKEKSRRH